MSEIETREEEQKGIANLFQSVMKELIRNFGCLEGSLDTLVSMLVNSEPEISMSADRLTRILQRTEELCTTGLEKHFQDLNFFTYTLLQEYQKLETAYYSAMQENKVLKEKVDEELKRLQVEPRSSKKEK